MSGSPPPITISVVIPTHQRRELSLEAIESAIRQDRPADEIIVVDDGSTDGTSEAIRRKYGSAVRLLRQDNRGLSAARNAGVRISSGELIAFLDDDDLWLPNHLFVIEAIAVMHPDAVLVSTGWAGLGEQDQDHAMCVDLAPRLLLGLSSGVGQPSGFAVRRHAYDAVGGCDERMPTFEDWELQLQLSLLGPIAFINGKTFERRVQPDSLWMKGKSEGGYLDAWRLALPKLLVRLGQSPRDDAPLLRRTVAARIAREAAISALVTGAPAHVVRTHLVQACRFAPLPRRSADWIVGALPVLVPNWNRVGCRLHVLATLLRAWPERQSVGGLRLLRASVLAAVGVQGDWSVPK